MEVVLYTKGVLYMEVVLTIEGYLLAGITVICTYVCPLCWAATGHVQPVMHMRAHVHVSDRLRG